MRIAFLVGEFPALSETFILSQITGLIDLGHQIDIYALRRRREAKVHPDVTRYGLLERTRYMGVPVRRRAYAIHGLYRVLRNLAVHAPDAVRALDVRRYGESAATLRLQYAISPFLGRMPVEYDILHAHFGHVALYGLALQEFGAVRGKLVTSFHGFDVGVYPRLVGRNPYGRLFRAGHLFTANSEHTAERLRALGCPPERLVTHAVGVDIERFAPAARPDANGAGLRLLTVARLVEEKGIEYGIRAVAVLARRDPGIVARYDIVGDGPLRPKLLALAARLGAAELVRFHGWATHAELPAVYGRADVFLLPSVRTASGAEEGAGVVLLEAQAAGLPVIASRVGGIPEFVREGESAVLVPERDSDALARAVVELGAQRATRRAMGEAGRRYVAEHFDIRELNRRLVALYERLAHDGAAVAAGTREPEPRGGCAQPAAPGDHSGERAVLPPGASVR